MDAKLLLNNNLNKFEGDIQEAAQEALSLGQKNTSDKLLNALTRAKEGQEVSLDEIYNIMAGASEESTDKRFQKQLWRRDLTRSIGGIYRTLGEIRGRRS